MLLQTISELLLADQPKSLKQHLDSVTLKSKGYQSDSQHDVAIGNVLYNHLQELSFEQFTNGLMSRGHHADAMVFSMMFLPEEQRMSLIVQYMVERGYTRKGSYLFTLLAIGSGAQDDLIWEEGSEVMLDVLKDWRLHAAFVL